MNHNYLPRIIPASAGTGKTYRLSLEFIGLLIKYRDVLNFDEIVVITFTRKATAEIKARIIHFLQKIACQEDNYLELEKSITDFYPEIIIDENLRSYLKKIYQAVITNKSQLRISTLDAFINQIFRSLIAPYYNISDYDIDPDCNDEILPQLYNLLLSDKNYRYFQNFFSSARLRSVSQYDNFIKSVLNNRWLFEFYFKAQIQEVNYHETAAEAYLKYQKIAKRICSVIADFVSEYLQNMTISKIFLIDWYRAISEYSDKEILPAAELKEILYSLLCDKSFLDKNRSWATSKKLLIRNNLLKKYPDFASLIDEYITDLYSAWINYLFYELALPQQEAILNIARILFAEYDKIKFHQKVFTYDDLAAYTWKCLYNEDISLIQDNEVLNIFYEQLAYRIKFILIDEFQDTSIIQWNIFAPLINELVAGSGISELSGLIIVGDEKQSIYGWRSGERDLLINIKNILRCQTDNVLPLTTSYRSSKKIIEFVNGLFGERPFRELTKNLNWTYPRISCNSDEEGFCQIQIANCSRENKVLKFPDIVREFVCDTLKPAINDLPQTINPQTTAILTRKNSQVKTICAILREEGIDYLDDAGHSILTHRAILPLTYLLRWFNDLDFYSLVLFFRSNAVLMPSKNLKKILNLYRDRKNHQTTFYDLMYSHFADLPVINALQKLHQLRHSPIELIKNALKLLNFNQIFSLESDRINIQKFLDITAGFSNCHDYQQNLSGFLQYLDANNRSEAFAQIGVQKQSAIKVMTIHKAKGLEFDTVILMLSSSPKNSGLPHLAIFPEFNYSYSELASGFFTYNYKSLLEHSNRAQLYQLKEIKDNIEDINLWYVALTRPKRNLFLVYSYKNKKGLKAYLKEFNNNVNKMIIYSIIDRFADYTVSTPYKNTVTLGALLPNAETQEDNITILPSDHDVSRWFDAPSTAEFEQLDNWQKALVPQSLINSSKAALYGNIAHYYLQLIEFDSPKARLAALTAAQDFYGSLVTSAEFQYIIKQCNNTIDNYRSYFDDQNWNVALREYSVFDDEGKEFRIDRLLVSHTRKEILVIDYKTGQINDPHQIKHYNQIISTIPFVKKNNFTVMPGVFLNIALSKE